MYEDIFKRTLSLSELQVNLLYTFTITLVLALPVQKQKKILTPVALRYAEPLVGCRKEQVVEVKSEVACAGVMKL